MAGWQNNSCTQTHASLCVCSLSARTSVHSGKPTTEAKDVKVPPQGPGDIVHPAARCYWRHLRFPGNSAGKSLLSLRSLLRNRSVAPNADSWDLRVDKGQLSTGGLDLIKLCHRRDVARNQ